MLKSIFSLSLISEKLLLVIKRFPLSVLLVILLAITFFAEVHGNDVPIYIFVFFSFSVPVSVAAVLFCEDFLSNLKTWGISFVAILLCGVYSSFLPNDLNDVGDFYDSLLIGKAIEIFVFYFVAVAAIYFISFLKKNKDSAYWNFTSQTNYQISLAYFFGITFYGGLSLALIAVDNLFGVYISRRIYSDLAVLCFALFSPIYFLANIPNKTEKHNPKIFYAKPHKVLSLYVLTPILAIYTAILYVYLLKIIFTWELPRGDVSWLVFVLATGGLVIISLFYPLNKKGENKVITFISRWFGLLILPLLMLMSIAIFRRISDYGITINRCYMLLLNLWFYGIYIYLFVTRSQSIKWILISFTAIALLTSVNIWGVSAFTQNYLTKEIKAVFNEPISAEEAKAIIAEKTEEEQEQIKSKLEYLSKTFGKESIQKFFIDETALIDVPAKTPSVNDIFKEEKKNISYSFDSEKVWNIEKLKLNTYSNFTRVNNSNYKRIRTEDGDEIKEDKDAIVISVLERNFSIPIRERVLEYLELDEGKRDTMDFVITGENYALFIEYIYGNYYPKKDSIAINNFNGYLLYK